MPIGALTALSIRPSAFEARVTHPEPRPGIDGSEVLTREALSASSERVRVLYDRVRKMPHIVDGIRCYCGCADRPGYRSLLTCYYKGGMAMDCGVCKRQAQLAYEGFQEGQTLEEIRQATDDRFG